MFILYRLLYRKININISKKGIFCLWYKIWKKIQFYKNKMLKRFKLISYLEFNIPLKKLFKYFTKQGFFLIIKKPYGINFKIGLYIFYINITITLPKIKII